MVRINVYIAVFGLLGAFFFMLEKYQIEETKAIRIKVEKFYNLLSISSFKIIPNIILSFLLNGINSLEKLHSKISEKNKRVFFLSIIISLILTFISLAIDNTLMLRYSNYLLFILIPISVMGLFGYIIISNFELRKGYDILLIAPIILGIYSLFKIMVVFIYAFFLSGFFQIFLNILSKLNLLYFGIEIVILAIFLIILFGLFVSIAIYAPFNLFPKQWGKTTLALLISLFAIAFIYVINDQLINITHITIFLNISFDIITFQITYIMVSKIIKSSLFKSFIWIGFDVFLALILSLLFLLMVSLVSNNFNFYNFIFSIVSEKPLTNDQLTFAILSSTTFIPTLLYFSIITLTLLLKGLISLWEFLFIPKQNLKKPYAFFRALTLLIISLLILLKYTI